MPTTSSTTENDVFESVYSTEELLASLHRPMEELDAGRLLATPPHVLAHFLNRLAPEDCRLFLRTFHDLDASAILAEMDSDASAEIVSAMREWRALKILEEVEPDDAADIILELDEPDRIRLLGRLDPDLARKVRALLKYEPDTAGGVMTPNFLSVKLGQTVQDAVDLVRRRADEAKGSSSVYVLDSSKKLVGVFPISTLVYSSPDTQVDDLMDAELAGLYTAEEDRETVAQAMAELNVYELPIVDTHGRLLGIVEHDDVIDIIQTEATEDFQKLVGAGADESIHDAVGYSLKRRFPWLIVNLVTAICGALVISKFQISIEQIPILAIFMPAIASLGGNVGAQTLAVAIRSLTMGDLEDYDNTRVCLREGVKGLFSGFMLGLLACTAIYFITHDIYVVMVVFLAMVLNMTLGGFVGALIPLLLKRFGLDPAQSASIFLNGITDICGFFIFLSIGSYLLL